MPAAGRVATSATRHAEQGGKGKKSHSTLRLPTVSHVEPENYEMVWSDSKYALIPSPVSPPSEL